MDCYTLEFKGFGMWSLGLVGQGCVVQDMFSAGVSKVGFNFFPYAGYIYF